MKINTFFIFPQTACPLVITFVVVLLKEQRTKERLTSGLFHKHLVRKACSRPETAQRVGTPSLILDTWLLSLALHDQPNAPGNEYPVQRLRNSPRVIQVWPKDKQTKGVNLNDF